MNNITTISLPISDSEEIIYIQKEKKGKIIEPEICIGDNTQTHDGVVCYI